jgi:hypothetical protein
MIRIITLTTLQFLLLPVAAMAQRSGTLEEQRACSIKIRTFCRSEQDQGDFAVLACLQQHRDKLSSSCKKVLITPSDRRHKLF